MPKNMTIFKFLMSLDLQRWRRQSD